VGARSTGALYGQQSSGCQIRRSDERTLLPLEREVGEPDPVSHSGGVVAGVEGGRADGDGLRAAGSRGVVAHPLARAWSAVAGWPERQLGAWVCTVKVAGSTVVNSLHCGCCLGSALPGRAAHVSGTQPGLAGLACRTCSPVSFGRSPAAATRLGSRVSSAMIASGAGVCSRLRRPRAGGA